MRTKIIVRAGISKAIAGCDGNREFVSVLETVNAAGEVIPPLDWEHPYRIILP